MPPRISTRVAQGRGGRNRSLQPNAQIRPLAPPPRRAGRSAPGPARDARPDAGGVVDRRVLLLDQLLRQPREGRVLVGAVVVKYVLGVLLRVIQFRPAAQIAQFDPQRSGVAAGADCRSFSPISACCSLMLCSCTRASSLNAASCAGKAVSRFKGAPGLLRIALDQRAVAQVENTPAPPRCAPAAGCFAS